MAQALSYMGQYGLQTPVQPRKVSHAAVIDSTATVPEFGVKSTALFTVTHVFCIQLRSLKRSDVSTQ